MKLKDGVVLMVPEIRQQYDELIAAAKALLLAVRSARGAQTPHRRLTKALQDAGE